MQYRGSLTHLHSVDSNREPLETLKMEYITTSVSNRSSTPNENQSSILYKTRNAGKDLKAVLIVAGV